MNRLWVILLIATNFLLLAPHFAAFTYLPQSDYSGMVISITMITSLPVKLFTGAAIDRGWLRLKTTLLITIAATAVVSAAYLIPDIIWFVRVVHGITFGLHLFCLQRHGTDARCRSGILSAMGVVPSHPPQFNDTLHLEAASPLNFEAGAHAPAFAMVRCPVPFQR